MSSGRAQFVEEATVFDLVLLTLLAIAFAGAVGYVCACDDLTRSNGAAKDESP